MTLKSGQLREYLKYALGEIVLVVLGILIALQINTWNEERKIRKEQELTNNILVQSFSLNNLEIEKTILEFEKSLEGTNLRIINSGPNIQNVSPTLIDSIREIDIILTRRLLIHK